MLMSGLPVKPSSTVRRPFAINTVAERIFAPVKTKWSTAFSPAALLGWNTWRMPARKPVIDVTFRPERTTRLRLCGKRLATYSARYS